MKVSAIHDDWHEIVCCGLENQQIDFKSHQNWETIGRIGRAKFARHAMALANSQGGYVVIGVSEDENGIPNIFTGMTDEEASSFDPSKVGQTINSFADPPVSLDIVRPMLDGKRYVIMVVYPFSDIPHVCSENCEHELQRGGFYIRTPDARSQLAAKSSEIHPLIRRALRNQRQMLGRMLRGILYEDKQTDSQESEMVFPVIERCNRLAVDTLGAKQAKDAPLAEIFAYPEKLLKDIRLGELRNALQLLERPSLSDIPMNNFKTPAIETFATNESIRGIYRLNASPIAFWEISCSGIFYLAVINNSHDASTVDATQIAHITFLTLEALGELYSLLNHPDTLLNVVLRISRTENIRLVNLPFTETQQNEIHNNICRIPEIKVICQRTPADLEGGAAAETTTLMFSEICQRFNAPVNQNSLAKLRQSIEQ